MIRADKAGRFPLHYAAAANDADSVHHLLNHGADPNAQDGQGLTPLHLAAGQGAVEAAQILLTAGARVDLANRHGNTPLWTAVFNSRGTGEVIQLLRRYGADPNRPNNAGQAPVDLARRIANYDVAQFFADLSVLGTDG
jgi:ankyrin repeat protein